jgi:hypothetical protein
MDVLKAEKRRHTRVAYHAMVDLTVDNQDYSVFMKDISLGGAFISGDHLPPLNKEMRVILTVPDEDTFDTATLSGTVRRLTEDGAGIEFF